MSHTKDSVITFIAKLISELINSSVKVLQLWSDGPRSQFKDRFIAAAIPWLEEKYSIKLFWNFFVSSHGKGPVNWIGCTTKRIVTQKVIQQKLSITDALSFYQAVRNESKVNVFVSVNEIREMFNNTELGDIVKNAPEKPGIFSSHSLKHVAGCIEMLPYSTASCLVNELNKELVSALEKELGDSTAVTTFPEEMLKSGSFVTIAYDYATSSSNLKSITKRLVALVTNVIDQTNIEVHYTEAISEHQFRITQGDIDTVQEKDM